MLFNTGESFSMGEDTSQDSISTTSSEGVSIVQIEFWRWLLTGSGGVFLYWLKVKGDIDKRNHGGKRVAPCEALDSFAGD